MTEQSKQLPKTGVRLFILDLRIRLKGLRPSPSPPTMPLKFKPGEETSVIEGLRAEVPGIPPSPLPLLAQRKNPGRAILAASNLGWFISAAEKPWAGYLGRGKTLCALFGPRKNPGRAILAAEKLGRALFWLRKIMRTHTFSKCDMRGAKSFNHMSGTE